MSYSVFQERSDRQNELWRSYVKKLGGKYAQPPAQHYPAMPSPVQPPVEEVVDKMDSWFQGGGGPSTEQGSPRMGLYGDSISLGSLHGGGLFPPNYNSDISRKRHKGMQSQKTNNLKKKLSNIPSDITPKRYANKLLEAVKIFFRKTKRQNKYIRRKRRTY